MIDSQHPLAVQTTGHTWDGDIQEFNNLIPKYWLRGFYATIVFSVCYWLLYPAWPIGRDYTKGILNQINYHSEETTVRTHWNSRALLLHTLQEDTSRRREYLQKIASTPFAEIAENAELMAFSYALAKRLFGDNCVSCHDGNIGFGANLFAARWKEGTGFGQIEQAIINSHKSKKVVSSDTPTIPSWKNRLSLSEIKALTIYIHQIGRLGNVPP